ncbi:hypothetical protein SDRG_08101 [Saprolegnia diclina VS20]|uniref:Uncharacterized protein n=1 Tax=Saprolegnia diclina (strain VS20) TaxID=1156394 RepID=T0RPC5_SAPDV|nr:hypothetical protein SDRG_08101 [Saprolegnia diclina VS20]EQC34328.1 hypothetical protein SDRG_08101 [Saprolegnia diclina VS20]|eukprot:XP_008612190.1 hypothetical protein SDRG_08101 [Saprolegnia diclina VS20]
MPASLDTILPAPVLSNAMNSVHYTSDDDVELPNIYTYFHDFTFETDANMDDMDAVSVFIAGLEYLKHLFMTSAPPTAA